jgi:hypothetical protein
MMRVIILNAAFNFIDIISVVMLSAVMLSVVMLNVLMLNVVVPLFELGCFILTIDSGTSTSRIIVRLL